MSVIYPFFGLFESNSGKTKCLIQLPRHRLIGSLTVTVLLQDLSECVLALQTRYGGCFVLKMKYLVRSRVVYGKFFSNSPKSDTAKPTFSFNTTKWKVEVRITRFKLTQKDMNLVLAQISIVGWFESMLKYFDKVDKSRAVAELPKKPIPPCNVRRSPQSQSFSHICRKLRHAIHSCGPFVDWLRSCETRHVYLLKTGIIDASGEWLHRRIRQVNFHET